MFLAFQFTWRSLFLNLAAEVIMESGIVRLTERPRIEAGATLCIALDELLVRNENRSDAHPQTDGRERPDVLPAVDVPQAEAPQAAEAGQALRVAFQSGAHPDPEWQPLHLLGRDEGLLRLSEAESLRSMQKGHVARTTHGASTAWCSGRATSFDDAWHIPVA